MLKYRLKGFYILTGHFKLDYSVIDSDKLSLIKNECLQSSQRWTYTHLISYCNASGQMLKRILDIHQPLFLGFYLIFFHNLGPAEKEIMQTEPVQVIVLILAGAPKITPGTLPICPLVEIPKGFSGP